MSKTRGDLNKKSLEKIIKRSSRETRLPDGSLSMAIGLDATREVSKTHQVPQREVEVRALSSGIVPERYLRNLGSIGAQGQIKLLESVVVVVGMGGLGGTVAKNLARVGVGGLTLVDGDVFSEDNLNRQEFAYEENIGKSKVEAAAKDIGRINSSVSVEIIEARVGEDELVKILDGKDAAIDALDNIPSRFSLGRAAKSAGVPVVHGSVAGFVGQVSTILPEDRGYEAIYGEEKGLPERGVEVTLGNLSGIVGTVSAIQSMEAVKILCGVGASLRGRLLFIDLENMTFEIFRL